MKEQVRLSLAPVGVLSVLALAGSGSVWAQSATQLQVPDPGVPEVVSLEGRFVRAAYNDEALVTLGYRLANQSVGEEWMLLEVGVMLRSGVPSLDFRREAISLETPDGKTLRLPSDAEFRAANPVALQVRQKVQRDSIDYFPQTTRPRCVLQFFADLDSRSREKTWDKVELFDDRACLGRLYFQIPGKVAYGQHWLNVKLANSVVRVPFRIMTRAEEQVLDKNFGDIKKQVDEAFKPKS